MLARASSFPSTQDVASVSLPRHSFAGLHMYERCSRDLYSSF